MFLPIGGIDGRSFRRLYPGDAQLHLGYSSRRISSWTPFWDEKSKFCSPKLLTDSNILTLNIDMGRSSASKAFTCGHGFHPTSEHSSPPSSITIESRSSCNDPETLASWAFSME